MDRTELDALHAKLRSAPDKLRFDARSLGLTDVADVWSSLLRSTALDIDAASVSEQDDAGNFRVTGRVATMLGFIDTTVELSFFVVSIGDEAPQEDLHCAIRGTGPGTTWRLDAFFPDLQPSPGNQHAPNHDHPLANVTLEDVSWALSSHDFEAPLRGRTTLTEPLSFADHPLRAGLSLAADFPTTGAAFEPLRKLLPAFPDSLQILAAISPLDDTEIGILLRADLQGATLALSNDLSLSVTGFQIESGLSAGAGIPPTFALGTRLEHPDVELDLLAELDLADRSLRIAGRFADQGAFSIADLAALLKLRDGPLQALFPDADAGAFGSLGLRHLEFACDLDPLRVSRLGFSVTTERPWQIFDERVKVTPAFVFEIDGPGGDDQQITARIDGSWNLAGTLFATRAELAGGSFHAAMLPNQVLDVGAALRALDPGLPIPELRIDAAEFRGNVHSGDFAVLLGASELLRLDFAETALEVRDVVFRAARTGGTKSLEFGGSLDFAGTLIQLHAIRKGSAGWQMDGLIRFDEDDTLVSLVQSVLTRFHAGAASSALDSLPEALRSLRVEMLSVRFDSGEKRLEARMRVGFELALGDHVTLRDFDALAVFDSTGLQSAHAETTLVLAGVPLTLRAAKHPEEGIVLSGSNASGEPIPVGTLMADLAARFGVAESFPPVLEGLTIDELDLRYASKSREVRVLCTGSLALAGEQRLTAGISIAIGGEGAERSATFAGHLELADHHRFDLQFHQEVEASWGIASYTAQVGPRADLTELVAAWLPDQLPLPRVEVALQGAFLLLRSAPKSPGSTEKRRSVLFGVALATEFDLGKLPLAGEALGTVSIDDMRLLVATAAFDAKALAVLREMALPALAGLHAEKLDRGLHASARLQLGTRELPLDVGLATTEDDPDPAPKTVPATPDSDVKWFAVDRTVGPVHLGRVGLRYRDGELWFLLDASLSALGLTLSLDGLAAGSPLDRFAPRFDLEGLGLTYEKGPVAISGAFLRRHVPAKDGLPAFDEFSGAALIRTEALTLSAMGSYAKVNGQPSLFLYAVLDYPLGGPSFFFVTGLAAGFGINRGLVVPDVDQIEHFPLVADAVAGAAALSPAELPERLERLGEFVPVRIGELFFAIGIKFNSFKLIDSFALLTVSLGKSVEVNLVGLSTLVVPTPEAGKAIPPLAVVQIAIKATYAPDAGLLAVRAQLTSASYVFSPDCRLQGGFAFFSWFSGPHAGDFVATFGGYHPRFKAPAHYPQVPRVGFLWKVDSHLTVKGSAYYALTAHALMAGGSLECSYRRGSLEAWFKAGADFLIAWKPYHYDAHLYVGIGASLDTWLGKISVNVGADVHVWGPEFAGVAEVDVWVTTVTVSFGDGSPALPPPIDWKTFEESFLPARDQVCAIAAADGLVQTLEIPEHPPRWILDPTDFRVLATTTIPVKRSVRGLTDPVDEVDGTLLGIAPMAVPAAGFASELRVRVLRGTEDVTEGFDLRPIRKGVPAALWGLRRQPDLNGAAQISNRLHGFELVPLNPPRAGATESIPTSSLRDERTDVDPLEPRATALGLTFIELSDADRREAIRASRATTDAHRTALLEALGVPTDSAATALPIEDFLIAPGIAGTLH